MIVQAARLPLKQHRIEVGAAALAAIFLGLVALLVNFRLASLNVPAACFPAWLDTGGQPGAACEAPVRAFLEINEYEAGKIFAAMAVLPFAMGLVGGVGIVGRELESRTAQTAWALSASRWRWFSRQLWPILIVLGVAITFAASATSILESTRNVFPPYPFTDLGLYGPLVVARGLAALGLGLLTGAVVGRVLPALIVGAVLSLLLMFGASVARPAWLSTQPRVVTELENGANQSFAGYIDEQAWRSPQGTITTEADAMAMAGAAGASDPYQWLIDHGFAIINFSYAPETTRLWEPLETIGFTAAGVLMIAAATLVVDRRRPV